jgi:hypothetical protein
MKHLYTAFLALLIVGSAALVAQPALAGGGYRYDAGCNCNRPVTSTRTVREAPRVIVHTRVENTNRVVPRYRQIEENQLVVHVRPVINREVVIHRQNIHYQNIVTKRINTIKRFREEVVQGGVQHRNTTTTSSSTVFRVVPGTNCNCGGEERVAIGPRETSYRY